MRKILFTTFMLFGYFSFAQTSIGGVITYYFNEYQGNKPDLGAKVYLVDSLKVKDFNVELFNKFTLAENCRGSLPKYNQLIEIYLEEVKRTNGKKKFVDENLKKKKNLENCENSKNEILIFLKENDIETNEKFDNLTKNLYNEILKLNNDFPVKSIDNLGGYNFIVKKGTYYVYVKSNNRKFNNIIENNGQIYIKKIRILENDIKDVSYNFSKI